jgi:hypothetical protein
LQLVAPNVFMIVKATMQFVGYTVTFTSILAVFRDGGVYDRAFGDGDRLARFLRWRVQVMERGVRALSLRPGGVNAIVQVTDLKDLPRRELRGASNQILSLFQDNYPEMVARKVCGKIATISSLS